MSVSKWRWTEACDGRPCPGDCDHCSFDPDDYISRADAVDACCRGWNNTAEDCIRNIKALPSAELPKGDLISRADAIEAVESANPKDKEYHYYKHFAVEALEEIPSAEFPKGDLVSREQVIALVDDMFYHIPKEGLLEEINALPSADAVQGEWIPCSERLPSESGDYLCTIPLDADETYTEVLTFHKGRFYEDDDEWGETYHDDVLAWMPLPKPYKGGDSE